MNFKGEEVTLVNSLETYVRKKQKLSKELKCPVSIVNYEGVKGKQVK